MQLRPIITLLATCLYFSNGGQALPASPTAQSSEFPLPQAPFYREYALDNFSPEAAASPATRPVVQARRTGVPSLNSLVDNRHDNNNDEDKPASLPTPAASFHNFEKRWVNLCDKCKASTGVTSFMAATRSLADRCPGYPNAKTTCIDTITKQEVWTDDCLVTVTRTVQKNVCILWVRKEGFGSKKDSSRKKVERPKGCRKDSSCA